MSETETTEQILLIEETMEHWREMPEDVFEIVISEDGEQKTVPARENSNVLRNMDEVERGNAVLTFHVKGGKSYQQLWEIFHISDSTMNRWTTKADLTTADLNAEAVEA